MVWRQVWPIRKFRISPSLSNRIESEASDSNSNRISNIRRSLLHSLSKREKHTRISSSMFSLDLYLVFMPVIGLLQKRMFRTSRWLQMATERWQLRNMPSRTTTVAFHWTASAMFWQTIVHPVRLVHIQLNQWSSIQTDFESSQTCLCHRLVNFKTVLTMTWRWYGQSESESECKCLTCNQKPKTNDVKVTRYRVV